MEQRISELREKHSAEPTILEVLDGEQKEIDLFRRYADAYGYVFYVMRKTK